MTASRIISSLDFGPPHTYNWNAGTAGGGLTGSSSNQMTYWQAAKALGLNNTPSNRCKIVCIGDSQTAGVGAGLPGAYSAAGYRVYSWPALMAQALTALGVPATFQNFFGAAADPNVDSNRVTLIGTAAYSGLSAFGGQVVQSTGSGNGFNFVPGGSANFDHTDIYYIDAAPSFQVQVGAQTAQTITPGSTNTVKMTSLAWTSTAPTTTVAVRSTTASYSFISGCACWLSTAPVVEIYNGGIGGAVSGSWTGTTGYGALQGAVAAKPQLAFIAIGVNDMNNGGVTAAQYQTNVQTMITQLQAVSCNVILIYQPPVSSTGVATLGASFYAALQSLAQTYNVPIVNFSDKYTSYAIMQPLGLYYGTLHPNGALYRDMGYYLANMIANV